VQELDDIALLRQYTEQNSEEAFAAFVARHVNKVYSVALRHTRNPHQAEKITQTVFVILAKKSRHLGKGVVLSGWLYQTARLTAVTFIRSEIRRTRREQEAHMQTVPNETESAVWPQLAPLLDAAMAGLNETDMDLLRSVGSATGGSVRASSSMHGLESSRKSWFFSPQYPCCSLMCPGGADVCHFPKNGPSPSTF
jgi:DNA-directed RNA polymerase specialized sigma24 family protein